ncbi:MAG: DegT/DnrJ/EryC1/StrS family aminotransferase [Magnetococcales bacterium]|nr:DegT/DnrJ/EryC1/StrS family aminotransferase [Magnetococcales bacterium]
MRPSRESLLIQVEKAIRAYCEAFHDFSFQPSQPRIRLHEPTFGAEEIQAAVTCLLETRVTMGWAVKRFEGQFGQHVGLDHAVMVNSGSAANLLAVAALANPNTRDGLRPGDEVIVSALSWSTTVWPIIQLGLTPVIVDCDPKTMNIDPNAVERAIGPRTRAIMPVHVYGNPCDLTALRDLTDRHGLILIEDCCEALGASYEGRMVGSLGRVGTFSFYYSHHMTTMEGGMCVSGDLKLAETMRILRAHGWIRDLQEPEVYQERHPGIDPRFLFVDVGYNMRVTELQGAMGSEQLPRLESMVATRQRNATRLSEALTGLGCFSPQQPQPRGEHSWFGLPLTLTDEAPFTVAALRQYLDKEGIESRPVICGNIAAQPAMALYPHRVVGDLTQATRVMERGLALPCHHAMDPTACDYLIARVEDFVGRTTAGRHNPVRK